MYKRKEILPKVSDILVKLYHKYWIKGTLLFIVVINQQIGKHTIYSIYNKSLWIQEV